ncbi:hypothetical protein F5B22DRAFT_494410 [Xylaria bambusicola]|uniref:uncharacterized protein n=1 Tax=Xylaria bambusicola TaxID=326684 RepID=UPI00200863BB|nr:uncharacterized protein F5B22DRAFT_494410 [Xylaria bambusicola]KAI0505723.1 hypothetical protein F5B22DRAFT_494410 [Xylaria bambusicola]
MDRYLGQLWSAPSMVKPEGKKLKRKLQKIGTQSQQRPFSINYSDTKTNSPEAKPHRASLSFNLFNGSKPSVPQRHALPVPINSEDSNWLEDFRKNGYTSRDGRRPRQLDSEKTRERPASIAVPEFAHLAAAAPVSPTPREEKTAAPPIKPGPPRMTRRYAKTPVSHVGQLETHPLLRTQGTSQDVPTIESIAESYRALLESRASFVNEGGIEHSPITEKQDHCFNPQDPSLVPPPLEPVTELPEPSPLRGRGSPRSDDGTLVGEDSIDFKRSTISSVPSSPSWTSYETASPGLGRKPTIPSGHSDLQRCLDLLTKELSSVLRRSPAQHHTDTTALQIWIMIEAYENLRNEMLRRHEGDDQHGPLKLVFDTWLKALHSIHDDITGGDGKRSESNYGD